VTSANVKLQASGGTDEMTAAGPKLDSSDDVRAFLAALAALLRDTVLRFEETVCRITHIVMTQGAKADRDLIVELQNFDRLQQEFAALGDTLARYSSMIEGFTSADDGRARLGLDVIAAISMADLKERLLLRLQGEAENLVIPPLAEEEIF
jgi:hypothetical protein